MSLIQRMRQLRGVELQLLLTVLLFFAAGYLEVVFATRQREFIPSVPGVLSILWPSSLPLLLFITLSLGLGWRMTKSDQILLPLVSLLAGMGLMLVTRLEPSFDVLYLGSEGEPIYADIAYKQTIWVSLGVVILAIMLFVPWDGLFIRFQRSSFMDWLDHHRYVWLFLGLGMIAATFVFGTDPNQSGVKGWFNFGLFMFQPSELLKIILVIFMASYLNEHREVVMAGYRLGPVSLPPLPYLLPVVIMWGIAMATIVFQRDLGAAFLLFGVFLAMFYVATGQRIYVVAGLTAFAFGSFVLFNFGHIFHLDRLVDVVRVRVEIWLDPWAHAQGLGYQLIQGAYAMAAGGIFGTGLGRGMPATVPVSHTDMAFVAIGEEMGLAVALAVLIAYILLIFRGYHIAVNIPGRFRGFEQLLATGLTTILAVQTIVIIGGSIRLIPLTGITLPFISYGGSSILANFLIIGLLMRISAANRET